MAEPKLQLEQRVDRIEAAMFAMLKSQTGFGEFDAKEIEKILRGEEVKAEKEDISSQN